jgi:hypothetical protein
MPNALKSSFEELAAELKKKGIASGGEWWLSPDGTRVVLDHIEPQLDRLRRRKVAGVAT